MPLFLLLLFSFTACCFSSCISNIPTENNPTKKTARTRPTPSLLTDTLYISIDFNALSDTILLTDSLTQVYLRASSRGLHYLALDSNLSYRGYDLGTLALNAHTQGRLIRFEPSYNDYSAIYLFLKQEQQRRQQAIEVAFSIWEEGVQGIGSSFLVQNDQQIQLYIKQYWSNYYGSDAETTVSIDDITPYVLSKDNFLVFSISEAQQQVWRNLFEQQDRQ